jgi:hypothetical protein
VSDTTKIRIVSDVTLDGADERAQLVLVIDDFELDCLAQLTGLEVRMSTASEPQLTPTLVTPEEAEKLRAEWTREHGSQPA